MEKTTTLLSEKNKKKNVFALLVHLYDVLLNGSAHLPQKLVHFARTRSSYLDAHLHLVFNGFPHIVLRGLLVLEPIVRDDDVGDGRVVVLGRRYLEASADYPSACGFHDVGICSERVVDYFVNFFHCCLLLFWKM